MSEDAKCEICEKPANQKCSACHSVFYCSKEHQKSGWKTHKKVCKPFKVCHDETLGRHLKATRDLQPGEVVLREAPLIWGPFQMTVPVCLGCGKEVNERNSRPCLKCGWPMCSEICEKSPSHIPECRYTVLRGSRVSISTFGVTHPTYQCITVLRCLYQKQFLPEIWKKLNNLQSHCEERRNTQKYEQDRTSVAQFILRFFKLANVFTEEDILRLCGIVMVNSHEVPLTQPPHVAIYDTACYLEHNCSANCSKNFTKEGHILITAGTQIKKGDNLSICYTDPLWGTPNRRHHLHESKFFWCACARCSDPTEFDTYFSALKCQNADCYGNLLPKTFLDDSSNGKGPDWHCDTCKALISAYTVGDLLERIGKDLADMPKGRSKDCKEFIKTYETFLHRHHFYLTDVKFALSRIIGQEHEKGLAAVLDEDLQLKIKLCQELYDLVKNLIPGERRVKGVLLSELQMALAELTRRSNPEDLLTILLESKKIFSEAAEFRKYDLEASGEENIYKQILTNANPLQSADMNMVQTLLGNSLM